MSQPPGPPGPYQQYPGQGQPPGGFGPPQGQPSGGFPQQQPGFGPPQGPPPGQYPPSGGFQQPGFDPYGGGQQKKSPMPWILGGVGALVVIGGVILLIVLLGGGGGAGSTPEDTGKALASAITSKDVDALANMSCEADKKAIESGSNAATNALESAPEVQAEFVNAEKQGDTQARANIKMNIEGLGEQTIPFPLVKENDEWLVCGTSSGLGGGGPAPVPGGSGPAPAPGGEIPGGGDMPSIPIPPPNYPTN